MPTFEAIQNEIANMLAVPDDELTPDQQKIMSDYLDELSEQEASKVDAFAQFIKLESAHVTAMKEEARRLASKATAAQNRIAWLKDHYLSIMQQHSLRKVQGNAYTLSVRESEIVTVPLDLTELEKEASYVRRKVILEPDKVAIKDALKSGAHIPGCGLRKSYSLTIR